jgi:hypothetical protein
MFSRKVIHMVFNKKINRQALAAFVLWLLVAGLAGLAPAALDAGDSIKSKASALIDQLTAEERAWLRAHPVIRVVQDPGWPPVEFVNEQGEYVGMAGDYLALIEQVLDVKFERVRGLSWQEAYARLQRREIDMTTSVAVTPEREQFWAFTKPYMQIPIVIISHANVTYIADIRELSWKKVAVVDGYAVTEWIPRDFPDVSLIRVKTAEAGLQALQRGEVYAYIENMLVVGYYMAKLKMTNLKIVGETPYVNAQSMAVRKDWAPLAGILDKALDSISEPQRNEIYRRWLPVRYEKGFDYAPLWYVLAMFLVILLGVAAWNWKLSREIESRKKVEIALRDSEEKFRLIFESANVGKSITFPTGEVNVNEAFCAILGYAQGELTGRKWQELTPPEDIEGVQDRLDSLMSGEKTTIRFDKRYIHKNGSFLWADLSVAMHRDAKGNPLYYIVTIVDITDRKRMEAELRRSETLLRTVMDNLPIGVAINSVDPEGIFEYSNDNFIKFYRTTREALASPGSFWEAVYENPQTRKEISARVMADCASGDSARMIWEDIPIERAGEKTIYISARNIPISGRQLMLSTVWDVTDEKITQDEIRSLNEALEQRVALRTRELRQSQLALLNVVDDLNDSTKIIAASNQSLEAVNKELAAFSYSVSHDLRAPLRSIDGFSSALVEDYGDKLNDEGKNYLERIRRATQNMAMLIDDMLNLSRVTQSAFRLEETDLSKIVREIADANQQRNPLSGLVVQIQDDVKVFADHRLMHIVMTNLLDNAWKFAGRKANPQIEFGTVMKEGRRMIFVRDNGVGFDMKYADKLFGTFQRLHRADEFPGTGIGLATVLRVINRHGGQVWAEGEVGRGATFYFTLPE